MNLKGPAFVLWLALVWLSLLWLTDHDSQPSPGAIAPARWPRFSSLPFSSHDPQLLIFLHPHCPCAQASLNELARLRAACPRPFQILAVVGLPGRLSSADAVPMVKRLHQIPDAKIFLDQDLLEGRRFGCYTSGQVLLYSPQGRLRYQGGLTGSRGHEGDNSGLAAALEALVEDGPEITNRPVFGCALRKDEFCGSH